MALPVVVANLWQAASAPDFKAILWRFWPVAAALIAGAFIGTQILSQINEHLLLLFVGLCVIAFTLLQASSFKLQLSSKMMKPAGVICGLASGLIGGVSSMFGPILILYFVSINNLKKDDFVSTISFLYVCAVVPWSFMLFSIGLLRGPLLLGSCASVFPVIAGMLLGERLRERISEQRFKRLMLLILLISGISMLWRAHTI